MPMRGLTIVVADISSERFRSSLNMALAQAALGGSARIFLDGEAVSIIREPIAGWEDDAYEEAGLPTLPKLYAEALDAGVRIILCQSGLAMTGAEPRDYDARVEFGGMVSLMAELGEDRLVAV
jgi:predicted peroxiredoxin